MAKETLVVHGYRQFLKAADNAGRESKKAVRGAFREVGDIVKVDAATRLREIDARSAAGLRTVVRARGVSVEQTLRKTTGQHPEYGRLQLRRALEPALEEKQAQVEQAFEKAIDKVADHFDHGGSVV